MKWTKEDREVLAELWKNGLTARQIALELGRGLTKNAVIGQAYRLDLPPKPYFTKMRELTPQEKVDFAILWQREALISHIMHTFKLGTGYRVHQVAHELKLPPRLAKKAKYERPLTKIGGSYEPLIKEKDRRAPVVVGAEKCPLCVSFKVPNAAACYSHIYQVGHGRHS